MRVVSYARARETHLSGYDIVAISNGVEDTSPLPLSCVSERDAALRCGGVTHPIARPNLVTSWLRYQNASSRPRGFPRKRGGDETVTLAARPQPPWAPRRAASPRPMSSRRASRSSQGTSKRSSRCSFARRRARPRPTGLEATRPCRPRLARWRGEWWRWTRPCPVSTPTTRARARLSDFLRRLDARRRRSR